MININNKRKNWSERFYNEWTELKRVIINTKRKYNDQHCLIWKKNFI